MPCAATTSQLAANEQQERPARYEQTVPLPGGLAMPNPVTQATGIDKLFVNSGAENEFAEADTWNEKLLAGFHLFGINLNPAMTALLSGGDWGAVVRTVSPAGQNRQRPRHRGRLRHRRPLQPLPGCPLARRRGRQRPLDNTVALLAQQALYDAQWGTNQGHQYPQEIQAAVTSAYQHAGGEMAFTDLSRFLTGIGFKAPMNADEARAEWLATTLQAMDANDKPRDQ